MPILATLNIQQLRNLESVRLQPGPGINLIIGENGSGKTSLLEGIYLLGHGRSFRTVTTKPLITHGQSEAVISGKLGSGLTLGIRKPAHGRQDVRIAGKNAGSAAELAVELPIQLLNGDAFSILDGSPKARRSYLDWGVFHVEPLFLGNWRHTLKSLKHRNALLKRQASAAELAPWNQELARYGERIDRERHQYLDLLKPVLAELLEKLMPEGHKSIDLRYLRGWPESVPLQESLQVNEEKDRRYGYTTHGPHRADIVITQDNRPAVDSLSRGQQKLLVCAMKLAQTAYLQQTQNRECLFLLDDLAAELDASNRARVCEILEAQQQQVFMTCIDPEQASFGWKNKDKVRLFHVKHGKISAVL